MNSLPSHTARWPTQPKWRLAHALGLVVFQTILNIAGFDLVAPLLLKGEDFAFRGTPREFAVASLIALLGGGLNVGFALCACGHISLRRLGWRWDTPGTDVAVGALGFLACAVVIFGMTAGAGGAADVRESFARIASYSLAQRALFLIIGLTAGFYEESLFRGYLQPAIVSRLGVGPAIIVTSLLFALYHLQLQPVPLITKTALGLILGALRIARPSLVAPAAAHALVWAVIGAA